MSEPKTEGIEIPEFLRRPAAADPVAETLADRGALYGDFPVNSVTMQQIKTVMRKGKMWAVMSADQREALEMIAHKIGRIVNGDPAHPDSWHDIAGYARLVETELQARPRSRRG